MAIVKPLFGGSQQQIHVPIITLPAEAINLELENGS
jgi:hypothetical protein